MKQYSTSQEECGYAVHGSSPESGNSSLTASSRASREQLPKNYQEISNVLSYCEAGSFSVGIPWLLPSKRVRMNMQLCHGPIQEFVRISLVGVSTNVLELYCDDLENIMEKSSSLKALHVFTPTFYERFAFAFVIGIILFLIAYFGSIFWGFPPLSSFICSLITSLGGLGLAIGLCLDPYRRAGFHALLYKELMRRRGMDGNNSNGVHIISVSTRPLAD